jgi:uncharacterized membrane protein
MSIIWDFASATLVFARNAEKKTPAAIAAATIIIVNLVVNTVFMIRTPPIYV